jgi:hypothetical protein
VRRYLLALFVVLQASLVVATPNPTGGSGTPGHNLTFTVTGSGFGSKISALDGTSLPWGYWDFEDGTENPVDALSSGNVAIVDQNYSVASVARGSSTKLLKSDAINWALFANLGIVSVVFNFPDQDVGQKQYFSAHRWSSQSSYTHTNSNTGAVNMHENWKFYRGFATSGTTYPNTVVSQASESAQSCTGGGGHRVSVESSGGATNFTNSAIRLPSSTWMEEEYIVKFNSVDFGTSGVFRLRQDGQANFDKTDYAEDRSPDTADDLQRQFIQDDPANQNDCGGSTVAHDVELDDLVADYGTYAWARVMLGNASTLAACTALEYQPATSWANGSITFKQKFGQLGTSSNKYIYVFDSNDTVNASGLLLQAGVGNPAPTLSSISVSTANYLGGTASTATGTGFLTGITCSFGPNAATSTTFSSATTLFLVAPPGTSAATVDLVCTNSDEQSATLNGAVAYTRAPEIPISYDDDPIRASGRFSIFRH